MSPRLVPLACHAILAVSLVASVLAPAVTTLRVLGAGVIVLPLVATWPGLRREDARILQRLAVLLVAYIGGISAEVVARSGTALLLNAALIAAVLELGTLLALIRRRPGSRDTHERTES